MRRMQQYRCSCRAVSLVELLVVLAIISILIGLALPAVMSARTRARELVCKNNLHQMNIAVANYRQIHKMYPEPGTPGRIGGWNIELLPFLEKKNLFNETPLGVTLDKAPKVLLKNPRIFRCPFREAIEGSSDDTMDIAHYVLVRRRGRKYGTIYDAPLNVRLPWAEGPQISWAELQGSEGPHQGGFFSSNNTDGVQFFNGGHTH